MKDLNDKTLRQLLIQRYLDGETTIEEERALVHFYQHHNDTFSADEENVRQLVLASTHLAKDFTLSKEKVEAFDRIMANDRRKRMVLWPWLAAACVAAILAIVLAPPRSDGEDSARCPKGQEKKPQQEYPQEAPMIDTAEVMPKTFLATNSPAEASTHTTGDQSDLISVDSVFGVESRPDPLAEYTALAEKLQRECNEVFNNNDIDFNF
jgi:hypothetical protein